MVKHQSHKDLAQLFFGSKFLLILTIDQLRDFGLTVDVGHTGEEPRVPLEKQLKKPLVMSGFLFVCRPHFPLDGLIPMDFRLAHRNTRR